MRKFHFSFHFFIRVLTYHELAKERKLARIGEKGQPNGFYFLCRDLRRNAQNDQDHQSRHKAFGRGRGVGEKKGG